MKILEAKLSGVKIIEQERLTDRRGYFTRIFCEREFASNSMKANVAQMSASFNGRRGTLRGLHFQYPPAAETKYVRCVRGAMLDVVVDVRPESSTYLKHITVMLSAANGRAIYVPERFAHGFITLTDETEVEYLMGVPYVPGLEGGLRYNDPELAIAWPLSISVIAERDASWPLLAAVRERVARRMGSPERDRS